MIALDNIDWNRIKFIAKEDDENEIWFVGGTEAKLLCPYHAEKLSSLIEEVGGFFEGYTNEPTGCPDDELPRLDEDGCSFDEFNIYLDGEQINDWTIEKLLNKLDLEPILLD